MCKWRFQYNVNEVWNCNLVRQIKCETPDLKDCIYKDNELYEAYMLNILNHDRLEKHLIMSIEHNYHGG